MPNLVSQVSSQKKNIFMRRLIYLFFSLVHASAKFDAES